MLVIIVIMSAVIIYLCFQNYYLRPIEKNNLEASNHQYSRRELQLVSKFMDAEAEITKIKAKANEEILKEFNRAEYYQKAYNGSEHARKKLYAIIKENPEMYNQAIKEGVFNEE